MFAADWLDDYAAPAPPRSQRPAEDGRPVRVLLFDDSLAADRMQLAECQGAIKVVDTAGSSSEVTTGMASLRPDVVVMRTDGWMPTAEFRATALALSEAKLADRAVMMVGHPAGFLALAVKAGAAGMLPANAPDDLLVSILREVRERLTDAAPVGAPRTTGKPADHRPGGGEM